MWATLCCAVLCSGFALQVNVMGARRRWGGLVRGAGGGWTEETQDNGIIQHEKMQYHWCNIWLILCSIDTFRQSSMGRQREVLSTTVGGNYWCSANQNSGRSRISPVENTTRLRRTVKWMLMLLYISGTNTTFIFVVCVHQDIGGSTSPGNSL